MTPSESPRDRGASEGVSAGVPVSKPRPRRFPWLLLLLLLASVYGFWIHPLRSPPPPVRIEWRR